MKYEIKESTNFSLNLKSGTKFEISYDGLGHFELILGQERVWGEFDELQDIAMGLQSIFERIRDVENNKEFIEGEKELSNAS